MNFVNLLLNVKNAQMDITLTMMVIVKDHNKYLKAHALTLIAKCAYQEIQILKIM